MNQYELALSINKKALATLTRILEKVEALQQEKEITEEDILRASLAGDMFSFKKQIQVATDDIRRNLLLLAGKEHVPFEDTETTLQELKGRVKRTEEVISVLSKEDFDGADDRHISLYWMGGAYTLGKDFIQEFVVQNTQFHVVTAYDIIRHLGGTIGKVDFIGAMTMHQP